MRKEIFKTNNFLLNGIMCILYVNANIISADNQKCFVFVQQHWNEDDILQIVKVNDSIVTLSEKKTLQLTTLSSMSENKKIWSSCSFWFDMEASIAMSLFVQLNDQTKKNSPKLPKTFCQDSYSNILVQTLVHLIFKLSFNNIVVLHEDNQHHNSLVKLLNQQTLNSTDGRFIVIKPIGIDVRNIDRSLQTLFQDKILKQYTSLLLVLSSLQITGGILDRAKTFGLEASNTTLVTRKGNFLKHHFHHIAYNVLGYLPLGRKNHAEESCRIDDILGHKDAKQFKKSQRVSEVSILRNDVWIQIIEATWQDDTEDTLLFKERSTIIGIQNIPKSKKPLRVVSIIDGPFLFSSLDFKFQDGSCTRGSIVCKVPIRNGNQTKSWRYSCCFGYSIDLLSAVMNILSIEIELYLVEDGNYGGFDNATKSFNGMIGDVIAGKADIAIAGLTINSLRSKYVDFTTPFMRTEIGILTLRKLKVNNNYLNLDFISNLADETKYAIVALYTFAIIILCGIDNAALYFKDQFDKKYRNRRHKLYPFEESFSYISGLSFQRDLGGVNPRSFGGRVTSVFFAFGMVAVSTVYTASLTANQVVQSTSDGFAGLNDPRFTNPTSAFTFGTTRDTSNEDFFRNAPIAKYNKMYHFMKNYNVDNNQEGVEKVINGELQAYLDEHPFLNFQIPRAGRCLVSLHSNTIGESGYGWVVTKGSNLKTRLSEAILLLQEYKELTQFSNKWFSDECKNVEHDKTEEFSLIFFATPLLFVAVSLVLCSFGVIIETYLNRYFNARKMQVDKHVVQTNPHAESC